MVELQEQELLEVKGGSISAITVIGIGALVVFLAGLISGYTNPEKCNN